ncbi:MAG: amidohydrolase family protein [Candidatus Binataceae bacterium]
MSPQISKSARIRERLGYPIIDSDGHTIENQVILAEYIEALAGPKIADRFRAIFRRRDQRFTKISGEDQRDYHMTRLPWWSIAARNTADRATAMLPKLLYERLGEMGLDYSVLYTTIGFFAIGIEDEELRRATCRALNKMRADMVRDFGDRLTAAAVIPMHTPQEAIEELEYAVNEQGMKTAMVASYVKRPIPALARQYPEASPYAYWLDVFALDSEYDYDPFWAKCVELGIAPTFHSLGYTWGSRQSISNYVYNHIGSFASSAEAICKGLFLGGVPARFPKLRFGFLEGGIPWAVSLFCELIGHWKKRNRDAMEHYNPDNVDKNLMENLARRYGRRVTEGDIGIIADNYTSQPITGEYPFLRDEFAQSGVHSPEDIRDIFVERFYFGCEGDDPLNAMAFNPRGIPFDAKVKALYGSDIGHWDVRDMSEVAEEAYELVEHGLITEQDMRKFVFENAIDFWTAANPDFFAGTAVERQVNEYLKQRPQMEAGANNQPA